MGTHPIFESDFDCLTECCTGYIPHGTLIEANIPSEFTENLNVRKFKEMSTSNLFAYFSVKNEHAVAKVTVQGKRIREGAKGKIIRINAGPKQRSENSSHGFIECHETGETYYFSLALNGNLRWVDWAAEEMSFDIVTRQGRNRKETKMAINLTSTAAK